jgi:hypothetical protein
MSATSTEAGGESVSDLHLAILDAINKGYTYVADVLDYCGPRLDEQSRGLDSAAYLREIDNLEDRGYIRREGKRFNAQLKLQLTSRGEEATPTLSGADQSALDEYGVPLEALSVLKHAIDFETAEGGSPNISQIQQRDNVNASAYRYTAQFNRLVDQGLAGEKGIFRYRIQPTDKGRTAVSEYEDHL